MACVKFHDYEGASWSWDHDRTPLVWVEFRTIPIKWQAMQYCVPHMGEHRVLVCPALDLLCADGGGIQLLHQEYQLG